MKANQRFIAGAVCPKCNEIDSLLLNTLDQTIECVDCGYQQTEQQRDDEKKQQVEQTAVKKVLPKKVDISSVIRVTNLEK